MQQRVQGTSKSCCVMVEVLHPLFRHKAPTLVQLERQQSQLVEQLKEMQEKLVC